MRKPSHFVLKLSVMVLCAAVLALWVFLELPCPIRHMTGIPCPGCGMSRAWLAVLRMDLPQAFRYHPMFWVVPVLGLFVLYDFRLFPKKRGNTLVLIFLGLAVVVCYLIRLAAFFHGELAV